MTDDTLVKNAHIKNIFKTMEYGSVLESNDLAKEWLNSTSTPKTGTQIPINDINTGAFLTYIYVPTENTIVTNLELLLNNDTWFNETALNRVKLINKFAAEIEKNTDLLSQIESSTRGILHKNTKRIGIPLLIEYLKYYASWSMNFKRNFGDQCNVCAAIIPDDVSLWVFGSVLGPALACGYSVILQTKPLISVTASLIKSLAVKAGLPDNALELIPGNIDLKYIMSKMPSLQNERDHKYPLKIVEVSNYKTPMIVFNSADLDSACECAVSAVWSYKGMLPWSTNMILVQEDVFEEFVYKMKEKLKKLFVGSSNDKLADISKSFIHNDLKKMIEDANLQGIEVYQPFASDYFQPTLFIGGRVYGNNVIFKDTNDVAAATILAFRTANEAINLANNSKQGLAASVWTENISLANEIVRKLKVGTVWINSHGLVKANVAYTTHKNDGTVHIGGPEGFYEYKDFLPNTNMPKNLESKNFVSSENLNNIVALAKKAQGDWNRLPEIAKRQQLVGWAEYIEINESELGLKDHQAYEWISNIYTGVSKFSNVSKSITQGCYDLKTYIEPIGLIAITIEDDKNLKMIIGSLLLGNAVILLIRDDSYYSYYAKLGKYLPKGLYNVVCHNRATEICEHKDIALFITPSLPMNLAVTDFKRLFQSQDDWDFVLRKSTLIKNVWSTVGNSF